MNRESLLYGAAIVLVTAGIVWSVLATPRLTHTQVTELHHQMNSPSR